MGIPFPYEIVVAVAKHCALFDCYGLFSEYTRFKSAN